MKVLSRAWWRIPWPWRQAAAIWADEQARAKPPAPGTPNATPPAVQPHHPPRLPPAPGFTNRELTRLTQTDGWALVCDPVRLDSARAVADSFREHFPHVTDDDLGRVLLNVSMIAREYGLNGISGKLPGTLALAAAELTRLTRQEVHLDL